MTLVKFLALALAVAHVVLPCFLALQFWALRAIPERADQPVIGEHRRWFVGALGVWTLMAMVRLAMPSSAMPYYPVEWSRWGLAWLEHPDLYVTWLSAANNACFLLGAYGLAHSSRARIERRYLRLAEFGARAALWVLVVDVAYATIATVLIGPAGDPTPLIDVPAAVNAVLSVPTAVVLARVVWGVARRDDLKLKVVSTSVKAFAFGVGFIAAMQPVLLVDWSQMAVVTRWVSPDAVMVVISAVMLIVDLLFVGSLLLWEMGRERVEEVIFRERVQERMAAIADPYLREELSHGLVRLPPAAAGNASTAHQQLSPDQVPDGKRLPNAGWIALGTQGVLAWAGTKQELRAILGSRTPIGVYYGVMPAGPVPLESA